MPSTLTEVGPLRTTRPDDAREYVSKAGVRALNLAHALRQAEGNTADVSKAIGLALFELTMARDLLPVNGWKVEGCSRCGDEPAEAVNGGPVLCNPCQRDDQIADGA
jgi:hypothetical protein